ncbi:sensor histidine kinase [Methylocystis bryophila]|nr:HAMP domain-containing sensor histidine kinase [Methylocystis bryophila]
MYVLFLLLSIVGLWKGNTLYLNDLAESRVIDLVSGSIRMGPNGAAVLDPTAELRDELQRTPTLEVAAFVPGVGAALPGSSQRLAVAVASIGGIITRSRFDFLLDGSNSSSLQAALSQETTPYGSFNIVVFGFKFRPTDLLGTIYRYMESSYIFVAPVWAISLIVGWLSLRHSLSSLRAAGQDADSIDLLSPDQRISSADLPTEITPFVEKINEALSRLQEAAQRQRRFFANSAHELRTPVTILKSRVDTLPRSPLKLEISRDVKRLQNIVEQLLAVTRLKTLHSSPNDDVNLTDLLQDVVGDYAPLVLASQRKIALETPDEPVVVKGAKSALQSVVSNLIDNALRVEPEGGCINLCLDKDAVLTVADHGEGVRPEDREKIFEPFWRKSEETPGAGLGLAIAKEVMNELGGGIWIEGAPGRGATFKVAFPRA